VQRVEVFQLHEEILAVPGWVSLTPRLKLEQIYFTHRSWSFGRSLLLKDEELKDVLSLCCAQKCLESEESCEGKEANECMRVSLSLFYKLRFVYLSLYFYLFLSSTYLSKP
jgi:hypothetical protein